jgi:hypothetical protein
MSIAARVIGAVGLRLPLFGAGQAGAVPAAGGQPSATKVLAETGAWVTMAGGGSGDVVGPSSSVASEVALFDGTTGKLLKRATGSGIAKLTSGVLSIAASGTDYVAPARAVNAGTGLTGGGDLSADRTLAVSYGSSAGTAAQGNDSRITGAVQGVASSVDSEVMLFDSTTGKLAKRASGSGLALLTSGVLSLLARTWAGLAVTSTASTVAAFNGSGNATNLTYNTQRTASGLLQLDAIGMATPGALLDQARYHVSLGVSAAGSWSLIGMATPSAAGTGGSQSSNVYQRRTNTTSSGFFQATRQADTGKGFAVSIVFKLPGATTNRRMWVGLGSASPNDSDTANGHFVGVRWSTVAGDAGWTIVSRNGTTQTVGAIGSAAVADVPYLLTLNQPTANGSVSVELRRLDTEAAAVSATVSATLPGSGTAIDFICYGWHQGVSAAVEIGSVVRVCPYT